MKYPIEQFNVLKEYLKKLSIYLDIDSVNPSLLRLAANRSWRLRSTKLDINTNVKPKYKRSYYH